MSKTRKPRAAPHAPKSTLTPERYFKLLVDMAVVSELKAEFKRKSMIYQYEEKCAAARHFGLTFEQVNLPFKGWIIIKRQYHQDLDNERK